MLRNESGVYFLDPLQLHKLRNIPAFPASRKLSLNVGISEIEVLVTAAAIQLPTREILLVPETALLEDIDARTILKWNGSSWEKWQYYDDRSEKFYKMIFVASGKPPTVEISGIKMHVTEDGNPALDTARKLRSLGYVRGKVLDTCCGLGYSAIALAQQPNVTEVYTVEKSPVMLRLCRENPWSQELFTTPKITLIEADTAEIITTLEDNTFSAILHDPPRYTLAPELYEITFYQHCYRVLRQKGRVYHYTGNPQKGRKRGLPERTMMRLKTAGFRIVQQAYQGVTAVK